MVENFLFLKKCVFLKTQKKLSPEKMGPNPIKKIEFEKNMLDPNTGTSQIGFCKILFEKGLKNQS